MTLLELVIACAILMILASAALPVARYTIRRQKEAELRRDLREMRDAIDRYKDAADRNLIRVEAGTEGYPPDLDTLVNGVQITGTTTAAGNIGIPAGALGTPSEQTAAPSSGETATHRVRFLRRIPVDPMTGRAEWGLRSVSDDPHSTSWGGKDVFDVYSLSTGTALDGSRYSDW